MKKERVFKERPNKNKLIFGNFCNLYILNILKEF